MAKHTYGFPAGTNHAEAIAEALRQAREAGYAAPDEACYTEIVETDEHRAHGEMCVVIRSSN